MADLAHKQEEALKDERRSAIFEYLRVQKKPASLGQIARGIDLSDLAKVHYHVNVLVEVELVEMVRGTRKYRLVGK